MNHITGMVVLTLAACDSRAELAALREQVEDQDSRLAALQTRMDGVASELAEVRNTRSREALAAVEKPDDRVQVMNGTTAPATEATKALEDCPGIRCTISSKQLAALRADPAAVFTEARYVQAGNGVSPGFKVFGLRPGRLFRAIGLRNGDLITEVNGMRFGTFEEVQAASGGLPPHGEFKIEGERKGEPLQLTVMITE